MNGKEKSGGHEKMLVNHIKRCVQIIEVLIIAGLISLCPICAASTLSDRPQDPLVTYNLVDLGVTVKLPWSYSAYTRSLSESNPILKEQGQTLEQVLSYMKENYIYLDAWPSSDADHEIVLTSIDSKKDDIYYASDNYIKEQIALLPQWYSVSDEMSFIRGELFSDGEKKYIKIYYNNKRSGKTRPCLQYHTVYEGKAYNITLTSYQRTISSSQEEVLEEIVRSITLPGTSTPKGDLSLEMVESVKSDGSLGPVNTVSETSSNSPSSSSSSISELYSNSIEPNLLIIFLLTALFYCVPILIYRFGIKKSPLPKNQAKKITIIYGLLAFIGVSAIKYYLLDTGSVAGGAVLLWSYINYAILKGGKESTSSSSNGNQIIRKKEEESQAPEPLCAENTVMTGKPDNTEMIAEQLVKNMQRPEFKEEMKAKAEKRNQIYLAQRPDDEDYGVSLSNPICTSTIISSYKYLSRLFTKEGEKLYWQRVEAFDLVECNGVPNVIVDKYQLYLNGEKYSEIYICPYGHDSSYAPKGMVLSDKEDSNIRGDVVKEAKNNGMTLTQYLMFLQLQHENDKMKAAEKKAIEDKETPQYHSKANHCVSVKGPARRHVRNSKENEKKPDGNSIANKMSFENNKINTDGIIFKTNGEYDNSDGGIEEKPILQYCRFCGNKIPGDSVFCPYCGKRL